MEVMAKNFDDTNDNHINIEELAWFELHILDAGYIEESLSRLTKVLIENDNKFKVDTTEQEPVSNSKEEKQNKKIYRKNTKMLNLQNVLLLLVRPLVIVIGLLLRPFVYPLVVIVSLLLRSHFYPFVVAVSFLLCLLLLYIYLGLLLCLFGLLRLHLLYQLLDLLLCLCLLYLYLSLPLCWLCLLCLRLL